jgi:hypothetical protein
MDTFFPFDLFGIFQEGRKKAHLFPVVVQTFSGSGSSLLRMLVIGVAIFWCSSDIILYYLENRRESRLFGFPLLFSDICQLDLFLRIKEIMRILSFYS